MVLEKIDKIEEKLDNKLDKSEFYKVLGLMATLILIFASFSMQLNNKGDLMFKCPICLHASCSLRWNRLINTLELHCHRCGRGTKVLSDDAKEIH